MSAGGIIRPDGTKDSFKVIKVLGKGSYGTVYKVNRQTDDLFYAMKETNLATMSQDERTDAVNEVRLLVSINHPNVIRYHQAFTNGTKLCVIMEYAPYGDLKNLIDKALKCKSYFPEELVWKIFLQMCYGLSDLHNNKIVHRDIKPANVFLGANEVLKIGDLGIAKVLKTVDFARTQIGTPAYMAPEVWQGRPYTYSSDLWSLGCVLYELMTLKVPINGTSIQDLKRKVISGKYTPVSSGRYSAELINICHSLLSLDPNRRPNSEVILKMPQAIKWLWVLPHPHMKRRWSEGGNGDKQGLISTIRVPLNLRDLPKKLPPPSYDSDSRKDDLQLPRMDQLKINDGPAAPPINPRRDPRRDPRPAPAGAPQRPPLSAAPVREAAERAVAMLQPPPGLRRQISNKDVRERQRDYPAPGAYPGAPGAYPGAPGAPYPGAPGAYPGAPGAPYPGAPLYRQRRVTYS